MSVASDPRPTQVTNAARNAELAAAEADLARDRERVAQSVMALRNEVARRTDWRGWIRRRPLTFLAGALIVGFLWGHRRSAGASNLKSKNRRTGSWK
jgi:hypothetical protein